MYKITYSKDRFKEKGIEKEEIRKLITSHITLSETIRKNLSYYEGNHEVLIRKRKTKNAPNNKPVCNHAKDIADTSTGFFMGAPVSYTSKENDEELDILKTVLNKAGADEVDQDNALDMARCGVAYEYVYVKKDENTILLKNLEPTNTFIVYDDTIEQNPLFAVYYYFRKEENTSKVKFIATVMTNELIYDLTIFDTDGYQPLTEEPKVHYFGEIPVIEYQNNKDNIGDYEQQIPLIDCYNNLMADRVNDKEQFIDAILVIYGAILGDDSEETSAALKVLKEDKLLELPEGSKAEYLSRTFDEQSVEVLRKAIKDDIYSFSHVPNLTDENFVGNSSGIAMEYKLLGLQMITNTKEKYYRKGLKRRFTMISNYLGLRSIRLNIENIIPEFTRSLPRNMLELSQIITNLKGTVSQKTLISQLGFVEDPQKEIDAVKKETEENIKVQQKMFNQNENTPIEETPDKEKEVETDE